MKFPRRLMWLASLIVSLFALPGLNPARAGLNRAGGLLYRDPRTSRWLIQDRIVPPPRPSGVLSSADLSSQMPPVGNQGSQGSCVAWCFGYYHKTHQEWLEHGWDVSDSAHQVSPAYIYNHINGGADGGAYFDDAQTILCEQGACSMQDFPYSQWNWWDWPSESAFARGILWRSDQAYWIDVSNDAGVARVKARLDSGITSVLGISVYSNFDNIQNFNYTYCASERYGGNRGGHGVTFVGYDDSKVTADGTGAFKLVNSWGTGWGLSGYWWMSYEAVKDNYLSHGAAYYVTDKIAYQPTLLARVQIMDSTRDQFGIRLGVGGTSVPLWTKDFREIYMWQQQRRPFPNSKLVYDMTEGDAYIASGATDSVFVRCIDQANDGWAGRIDSFSGEYLPWTATGVSPDVPVTIQDYNVAAYARARLTAYHDVSCFYFAGLPTLMDSGTSYTPVCSIVNLGYVSEVGFPVRARVGTAPTYFYDQVMTAPSLAPNEKAQLTFPSSAVWQRGTWTAKCSTERSVDTARSNDRSQYSVAVQVRDVGCSKIEAPLGTLDSGASITPACSVSNYGTTTEGGYTVRMLVGTGPSYYYAATATAPSLNPGERSYLEFSSMVATWPRGGPYPVNCSTEFTSDAKKSDNRAPQRTVTIRVRDVGCSKIEVPSGTLDSGASITPACSVFNYGTTTEGSYTVRMLVGTGPSYLYDGTATAPNVNPGQRGYVAFSPTVVNWPRGGSYAVSCSTEFTSDAILSNNRAPQRTVSVQVRDVGCSKIEFPFGTVDSGASITPACSVYNYGMTTEGSYTVRMLVGSGPSYYYNGTATAPSVNPGERGYVAFSLTIVNWPRGGPYPVRCSTELAGDFVWSNNQAPERTVSVPRADVGCSKIEVPVGTVDSGASVTPACSVYNYGMATVGGYAVRMLVGTGPSYYYNGTATAPSLDPGEQGYVVFSTTTANWPRGGPYAVRCSTELASDSNRSNNQAPQQSVSVQVRDVGSSRILYPSGTIDSGASITPACTVANYGTSTEGGYLVRMLVGTGPSYLYNGTATAPDVNPGQRGYVAFSPVTVTWPRGTHAVNCSTELAADAISGNDRAPSRTTTVRVIDVGCTKIEFPFGTLDSGASITPACSVYNYGTTREGGYLIRMLVGTGPSYFYNATEAAPVHNSGEWLYIEFPPVTVNWPRGGPYPVHCSTELSADDNRSNSSAPQRTVSVQVRDVGCTKIESPFGTVDSGASITPACSVSNYGTTTEGGYLVRMLVGTGPSYIYNGTAVAPSLNSGQSGYVVFSTTFAAWPRGGPYPVRCSTEFTNDANRSNNPAPQRTVSVQVRDVGCLSILAPTGDVDSVGPLSPQARVKNFGNQDLTAPFDVVFTIGSYSSVKSVPALAPGVDTLLVFDSPPWGCPRGPFSGTCATQFSGDMNPANDQQVTSGQVRVVDVGCEAILAPVGDLDSTGPRVPQARVSNYGDQDVTTPFDVAFVIGAYRSTKQVPSLARGESVVLDFDSPPWGCPRGAFTALCTTLYAGDAGPGNNAQMQTGTIRVWDVGPAAINAPAGEVPMYSTVTPSVVVQNFGTNDVTCSARLTIRDAQARVLYDLSEGGVFVAAGGQTTHTFSALWTPHETGRCSVEARTGYGNDANPFNDIQRSLVKVVPLVRTGWSQQANLPQGMRGKNVKDGGALAYGTTAGNDSGFVYGFKGNSTTEFYRFNTRSGAWIALDTIPPYNRLLKKKGVKKGALLVVAGNGHVYATKGNNTLDWWEYTPQVGRGTWVQKADVPVGAKKVKEGTGAVAVTEGGADYIYLLKGSATFEFYRYNVSADAWEAMPNTPMGGGKPYKTGSALAYDGVNTIYAVKGSVNEFFGYNIPGRYWLPLEILPLGNSRKKVKDGAGLGYDNGIVYGLKGGNTNEFWTFETWMNRWLPAQPMGTSSLGRRVKGGGGLVTAAGKSALYAFRGNNTLEFWSYGVPILGDEPRLAAGPSGAQGADAVRTAEFGLRIEPNPVAQSVNPSISYSLPAAGNVSLRLFDLSGKLVRTLASGYHAAGNYSSQLTANSSQQKPAAGVYLLKLESDGRSTTEKLVIE